MQFWDSGWWETGVAFHSSNSLWNTRQEERFRAA
jgi:hypothetical protein